MSSSKLTTSSTDSFRRIFRPLEPPSFEGRPRYRRTRSRRLRRSLEVVAFGVTVLFGCGIFPIPPSLEAPFVCHTLPLVPPLVSIAEAESDEGSDAFLPTWKLLTNEQKQQFIAGYLYAWKDAARVTDVAIGFVKENPKEAVNGLEKIKSLYDLSILSPAGAVQQLDTFFSEPSHSKASLSVAITAVKNSGH